MREADLMIVMGTSLKACQDSLHVDVSGPANRLPRGLCQRQVPPCAHQPRGRRNGGAPASDLILQKDFPSDTGFDFDDATNRDVAVDAALSFDVYVKGSWRLR